MIWHRNYVRATAWEKMRMDAIQKGGCVLSMYRAERELEVPVGGKVEIHHIVRGNKRLGHLYTVPLRAWYHSRVVPYPATSETEALARYGATIKHGMKAFRASHDLDDLDLWQWLQARLGMSTELPPTKIVSRRVA